MNVTSVKKFKDQFVIFVNGEIKGVCKHQSDANILRNRLRQSRLDIFWHDSIRRPDVDNDSRKDELIQKAYNNVTLTSDHIKYILNGGTEVKVDWLDKLIAERSERDGPFIRGRFDFDKTPEGVGFWLSVEDWQLGRTSIKPSPIDLKSRVVKYRHRWIIIIGDKVVGSCASRASASSQRCNIKTSPNIKVWLMITAGPFCDIEVDRNLYLQRDYDDDSLTIAQVERELGCTHDC